MCLELLQTPRDRLVYLSFVINFVLRGFPLYLEQHSIL